VEVDLVVNCFERTYRDVLAAGFFERVVAQNRFRFARRVVLMNNVDDVRAATRLAQARLDAGEIDELHRVADRLPEALRRTGLELRDLGAGAPHSVPSLVAVTLDGAPWVVHWDAEIRLLEPHDWVSDGLAAMSRDERILVAAPRWSSPKLEAEVVAPSPPFDLCFGFSDHVYLGRRAELGRPIYSERCVVRRRYPLAHRGYAFEARLDAYMRHHGRFRALHRAARYEHDDSAAGATYPELSVSDRARLLANRALIAAVRASPFRPSCCRTLERRDPVKTAEAV
jgi:hypothetical protein